MLAGLAKILRHLISKCSAAADGEGNAVRPDTIAGTSCGGSLLQGISTCYEVFFFCSVLSVAVDQVAVGICLHAGDIESLFIICSIKLINIEAYTLQAAVICVCNDAVFRKISRLLCQIGEAVNHTVRYRGHGIAKQRFVCAIRCIIAASVLIRGYICSVGVILNITVVYFGLHGTIDQLLAVLIVLREI